MRKRVAITVLIIFWAMCWLSWVMPLEADENTKRPSGLFEDQMDQTLTQRIEEAEILWKLKRDREALRHIEALLEEEPANPRVLETAASFYLTKGKTGKAGRLIERLEASGGERLSLLPLKGEYHTQRREWDKARRIYEEILERRPEDPRYLGTYAEILAGLREWSRAEEIYRGMIEKYPARKNLRLDYQEALEQGSPGLKGEFEYVHAPDTERSYTMRQRGRWWAAPWFEAAVGVMEEVYKKGAKGDDPHIDRLLITHSMEGTFYYGARISLLTRWQAAYLDQTGFHELGVSAKTKKGIFVSEIGYDWNHLSRDPILAIDRHGVIDRLLLKHSLNFGDRFEPGHELEIEWFRMEGKRNFINGADHLGHKYSNDFFANLVLFKQPYLALQYRYRDAHWNQKFDRASEVIGYLGDEQVHSGGITSELKLGRRLELAATLTRASDRKRRVDFVVWFFEMRYRVVDRLKFTGSYEYDVGDSGTAGSGNSQIMKTALEIYF